MTVTAPVMSRAWAMPSPWTFEMPPVRAFVARWLEGRNTVIDPFAGNALATGVYIAVPTLYTSDIDPDAPCGANEDALIALRRLVQAGVTADLVVLDPPYTPRQVAEVYRKLGLTATMADTQTAAFKRQVRDLVQQLTRPGSIVLSFGFNSVGMGLKRGWVQREILLVSCGGDHNDVICLAEERVS